MDRQHMNMETWTGRQTNRWTNRKMNRWTGIQTERRKSGQEYRQKDRQCKNGHIDRQTDGQEED